jgi:hypothetical protein
MNRHLASDNVARARIEPPARINNLYRVAWFDAERP